MKKGFTLIEMLIVIAIIGVLTSVMLGIMGGAGDSANAAKCMANMKNLSTAALATVNGGSKSYTPAGSSFSFKTDRKNNKVETVYNEKPGWISWNTMGVTFPATSKPSASTIGCYDNEEVTLYAITNGAIWKYMSGNVKGYCCPLHAKKHPGAHWSYFMNGKFGWQPNSGSAAIEGTSGLLYGKIPADRTLLFAEIPFNGPLDGWKPGENDTDADGILQYEISADAAKVPGASSRSGHEHIGANHKNGKYWFAHVSFADGHVEKIRIAAPNLKELTTLLCEGKAYAIEGGSYTELK